MSDELQRLEHDLALLRIQLALRKAAEDERQRIARVRAEIDLVSRQLAEVPR